MAITEYVLFASDEQQARLPDTNDIIKACIAHNNQNAIKITTNLNFVRGLRLDDRTGNQGIWVKYGASITPAEAHFQDYIAKVINGTPAAIKAGVRIPNVYATFSYNDCGFIVMEYIAGAICGNADAPAVAKAVQHLTSIKGPDDEKPGPIGGGPISHTIFDDCRSSVAYASITELQEHFNNILRLIGHKKPIDFGPEVKAHGLCLCLSDLRRNNFIKEEDGTIVAIDFGEASFLPVSFFHLALCRPDGFTMRLEKLIDYEPSAQLGSLSVVAYALVITGNNKVGLPAKK